MKIEVQSAKPVQGHSASKMEALRIESMTVPLQCPGSYNIQISLGTSEKLN